MEDVRNGVANLFMMFEPLSGRGENRACDGQP